MCGTISDFSACDFGSFVCFHHVADGEELGLQTVFEWERLLSFFLNILIFYSTSIFIHYM